MFVKNNNLNFLFKIFVIIVLFFLAISVWYFPVMFKGYSPEITGSAALVRAKNLAVSGIYGSDNNMNVIMPSERMKDEGHETKAGKKFSGYVYSYLIKTFNINTNEDVFFTNCVILALALVFFYFSVYLLFGFRTALLFSGIYIFLPVNLSLPSHTGYPIPLFFFSLFTLFLFLGFFVPIERSKRVNNTNIQKEKTPIISIHNLYLIVSGFFLSFACLASETFFLILPALFLYFLLQKYKKQILFVFVPVIILLGIFWIPDFFSGNNTYLLNFSNTANTELESSDYDRFGHIFPDQYTYHYLKDEYVDKKISDLNDAGIVSQLAEKKILDNFGYYNINIFDRLLIGLNLTMTHLFRFISLNEFGGPLIFLIFLIGMYKLKSSNFALLQYYFLWIVGGIFLMSFIILLVRNHLMDYGHFIALCLAIGILTISEVFIQGANKKKFEIAIQLILFIFVIYHFILIGHMKWGDLYNEQSKKNVEYISSLKKFNNYNNAVVAVPFSSNFAYNLNFNSGQPIVVFREETVKKLISSKQLEQSFDDFEVGYIFGYSKELSDVIILETNNKINKIEINAIYNREGSNSKNWFMNIIR